MIHLKKKRRFLQKQENVIVFPGMVETLIKDGLAFAEENNFSKAVACFDEVKKYEELDDMILNVYILTLLETGRSLEAKEICESLLEKKSPLFEEVVELYLTILLDLKEYTKVDNVLNSVVTNPRYTKKQQQNFMQLKELSTRLASQQEELIDSGELTTIDIDKEKFELDYFTSLSFVEQEQLLQDSFYKNFSDAIPELIAIAESKSVSATVQTLALLLLGTAGVSEEVTIEKFGFKQAVNPIQLPSPAAVDRLDSVKKWIQEFSQKDPSKQALTIELVHRHAYTLFPFDWKGFSDRMIAETYVEYVNALFGEGTIHSNELFEMIKLLEDSLKVMDNE